MEDLSLSLSTLRFHQALLTLTSHSREMISCTLYNVYLFYDNHLFEEHDILTVLDFTMWKHTNLISQFWISPVRRQILIDIFSHIFQSLEGNCSPVIRHSRCSDWHITLGRTNWLNLAWSCLQSSVNFVKFLLACSLVVILLKFWAIWRSFDVNQYI